VDQLQFEPHHHTKRSSSLLRVGDAAKSGFWGGIKAGFLGIVTGALACGLMAGFGSYYVAANPAVVAGVLTETVGLGASAAASITGAFSAFPAVALGLFSGIAGTFASLFTPIPYLFSIGSEWIGLSTGLYSGAKEGKEQVKGEQRAAEQELVERARTASVRDLAHQRAAMASSRLDAATSFIEQQAFSGAASNPLLQAGTNRIHAASVSHMGMALTPRVELARV